MNTDLHPDIDYEKLRSEFEDLIRRRVKHTDSGKAFLATDWSWLTDTMIDELEVAISKKAFWIYVDGKIPLCDVLEKVVHNTFGAAFNALAKSEELEIFPENWDGTPFTCSQTGKVYEIRAIDNDLYDPFEDFDDDPFEDFDDDLIPD